MTSVSWAGWVINTERKNASGDQGGSDIGGRRYKRGEFTVEDSKVILIIITSLLKLSFSNCRFETEKEEFVIHRLLFFIKIASYEVWE